MPKGYGQFILNVIEKTQAGVPIFTDEITDLVVREFNMDYTHAKKIVNTNLNRLNGKIIQNFKKGIYYKPKITAFGKAPLNPIQVATKMYLKDGSKVIGYETGASLLQRLGLTTQIPKYRFIATNRYHRNGSKVIEDLKLVLRKPNVEVTDDNILYLQLIDAIENKDEVKIDAEKPNLILNDYIVKNNLDYGKLVALVAKNYGKEVLKRVTNLAVETRL